MSERSAPTRTTPEPSATIRSTIGIDPGVGFYLAPRRYRMFVSPSCPSCLRLAITHRLLDLEHTLPLTTLPAPAEDPGAGHALLRPAYEATRHGYAGPARTPVLYDDWTGRIVSNHTPDMERDLTIRFAADNGPQLCPAPAEDEIATLVALAHRDVTEAAQQAGRAREVSGSRRASGADPLARLVGALARLDERLAVRPFLLGEELTAADIHVWVALLELDVVHRWHLDADAVHRTAQHRQLWSYARRLRDLPAFHAHLDVPGLARRHHSHCRGLEAAGAAVQIIDWTPQGPTGRVPAGPGGAARAGR